MAFKTASQTGICLILFTCIVVPAAILSVQVMVHKMKKRREEAERAKETPKDQEPVNAEFWPRMRRLIAGRIEIEESRITPDSDFGCDLGLDRVETHILVCALELDFGIEPDDKPNEFKTIRDVLNHIQMSKSAGRKLNQRIRKLFAELWRVTIIQLCNIIFVLGLVFIYLFACFMLKGWIHVPGIN
jgi:acyl carrier protein